MHPSSPSFIGYSVSGRASAQPEQNHPQGGTLMLESLFQLAGPVQALCATLMTWALTSLGACVVFLLRKPNRNVMDAMLGLAGGVMVAASFWSLLSPCIDMAEELGMRPWSTALIGFMGGGFLLFWGDRAFTHFSQKREAAGKNGRSAGFKRCAMLVFSITLHNIPEGLAIGVAFGSLAYSLEGSTAVGAWMLAVGIGLQNLPEGMAVSLPLRREGLSPKKAFFCGQLSGIVEPIAAVLGAILVMHLQVCLPFLLAFAAGAMIYVVVEELIPESQTNENKDWMALFTLVGFSLMMCLDVALG